MNTASTHSLPPWPGENFPTFFTEIQQNYQNSIFQLVEKRAAQAVRFEKDHGLIRKFNLISRLNIKTWNQKQNPNLIDHVINEYYQKINAVPYLSEQEKLTFLFTAFDSQRRQKVLDCTAAALAEAESRIETLSWNKIKTEIIPRFCRSFHQYSLEFRQPKWRPEQGETLREYFQKWLENYSIMKEKPIVSFTKLVWSQAIEEFTKDLSNQGQNEILEILSKSLRIPASYRFSLEMVYEGQKQPKNPIKMSLDHLQDLRRVILGGAHPRNP